MANKVDFLINIIDKGSTRQVTADAEELGRVIRSVQEESERLSRVMKWSQVSQTISEVHGAIGELHSVMNDLTSAYQVQMVAETQLETIMRERMGSTEDAIQSIKDLCSAQQEIGVVGDEVQLSGAQQMATFLKEKQSLDTLIPAMNDLIAQQNGLNATNQDAVSIGNMMGKAMQGQVDVLQRVGITFDESQKQVLQYGTESERAAMLAEVITANVGHMNAVLAKTDAGKQKQLENTLGDIKEKIGGLVQGAMPYVTIAAQTLTCVSSTIQLSTSLKTLVAAFHLAAMKSAMLAAHERVVSVAHKILAASGYTAAAGTTALRVAVIGLYGALTMGISVAVEGLVSLFSSLGDESEEASQDVDMLKDSTEAYSSAAASAKVEMDGEIKKLGDLISSKKDATDAVKHLNATYGDLFGSHKTASEWYDVLTRKSQIYVKQIGYEAQAKVLATKLAEKQIQLEANFEKRRELWKRGGAQKTTATHIQGTMGIGGQTVYTTEDTREYADLKAEARGLIPEINDLSRQLGIAQGHMADCSMQLAAVDAQMGSSGGTLKVSQMNWQQVADAIDATEKKLKNTTDGKEIARLKAYNKQLEDRKKILDRTLGLGGNGGGKTNTTVGNSNKPVADPKSYEELGTNIDYYKKKLTGADTEEQRRIIANIRLWEEKRSAIELAQKAASRPAEIKTLQDVEKEIAYLQALRKTAAQEELANIDEQIGKIELLGAAMERPAKLETLQDIDKEIEYQRKLRATANREAIGGIDDEIGRLNVLRGHMERAAVINTPNDALRTYDELNAKLAYYNELLDKGGEEQRKFAKKGIDELERLRSAWDMQLRAASLPASMDTVKDVDAAIQFYTERQQGEDADEIEKTQGIIDRLTARRNVLQIGVDLPRMQREMAEIDALTGKERRVKIQGMGFDELTDKIRELNRLLGDMENPVTDAQRKEIEGMIGTYSRWRRESVMSFDTVKEGWGGIKGIGDSIGSITDALDGNASAWQKVTGIVDGFIGLYESISTIVGIVKMLTAASTVQAGAETGKAAAAGASAVSQTAAAVAAGAEAAATVPLIVANKALAASLMEVAAAQYFATHAYIPFAGFGIGAGFAASAKAIVLGMGATPFAKGGVVSGPTLAMVGEYAGASNNPEVIAPLDKLRKLIRPAGDDINITLDWRLQGRDLVAVVDRVERLRARS